MLVLSALILIVGYALVASWAYRRGGEFLIASAGVALLLIAGGAVLLGFRYDVPSLSRLVLYMLGFAGPVIVVPTVLLLASYSRPFIPPLPAAILGAALGLVVGYLTVVFGLLAWS